ncbi:MAG TPA: phosphoribosylanthranilate isomerase [Nitrospirae bacterium]|nr:phosphoribosylanthranilate isomerase [Nitrospirota bacterium]
MFTQTSLKVKICGITKLEDAIIAVDAGADALGFVFYKQSPRYVTKEIAKSIIETLPPFVSTVGVFVNEDPKIIDLIQNVTGIDYIQLHGDESPDITCLWKKTIKAIRVNKIIDLAFIEQYNCSTFLLDTYTKESYGGTGQIFNWDIALEAKKFGKIILSGGLNPENISKAVRYVKPYAVDVSSGVESRIKGKKDPQKVRDFIYNAKRSLMNGI